MKVQKYIKLGMLLCGLVLAIGAGQTATASEFSFAVNALIPENQVDKEKTYFDLQMKPGDEQTLEVELKNDTEEEIVIEPKIHAATTNINGVVEYGKRDIEKDSTLRYPMEDIVSYEERVVIPPGSTYVLAIQLKMPAEEYEGVLAGGITLQEADEEEETKQENNGGGMSIKNKYAYVVGLVLHGNEAEVLPELTLNNVFAGQVNARNVINANIQNIMPMYMNEMKVDARITKKGSADTLYETNKVNMQMAPNSNFDFPVPLNGEKMVAGDYTIYLKAESMGEEWEWTKDFTITREEAKAFNESDVMITEDNTWIYILIGAAILIVLLIVMAIVMSKKKEKKLQLQMQEAFLKKNS